MEAADNPPANEEVAVPTFTREPFSEMPEVEFKREAEMPPVKVEVAEEVFKIEPAVMVKPAEDERPAAWMPPVKDEVAEPVTRRSEVAN